MSKRHRQLKRKRYLLVVEWYKGPMKPRNPKSVMSRAYLNEIRRIGITPSQTPILDSFFESNILVVAALEPCTPPATGNNTHTPSGLNQTDDSGEVKRHKWGISWSTQSIGCHAPPD